MERDVEGKERGGRRDPAAERDGVHRDVDFELPLAYGEDRREVVEIDGEEEGRLLVRWCTTGVAFGDVCVVPPATRFPLCCPKRDGRRGAQRLFMEPLPEEVHREMVYDVDPLEPREGEGEIPLDPATPLPDGVRCVLGAIPSILAVVRVGPFLGVPFMVLVAGLRRVVVLRGGEGRYNKSEAPFDAAVQEGAV